MECSCNAGCDYDNDELLGYSERVLKAAKNHICCECGKAILKGQEFIFCSILMVEDIKNYKMCPTCHAITQAFFQDGFMFTHVLNSLEDYLYENWKEDLPSNCISKLPSSAQAVVCGILQKFQEA